MKSRDNERGDNSKELLADLSIELQSLISIFTPGKIIISGRVSESLGPYIDDTNAMVNAKVKTLDHSIELSDLKGKAKCIQTAGDYHKPSFLK